MKIKRFSVNRNNEVKQFVLRVLAEEGFGYDNFKDFDLDDINGCYLLNGGMFFIGIHDGKIIGTSAVYRINENKCEIKRIYVKKEFRGMGYGKDLFIHALDYARNKCQRIILKTDRSLVKAINMYLKYGFSIVKEENDTLFLHYDA
ncbi:MAG: GNAT family N-acetyltransferase [Methanosarcinales archaeon]|nr:GNAT family N-acetyltransferase [Methanosarcinales archaeon]